MAKDTIGVQLLITMQTWKITLTAAATLLQLTQASPTPLISRSACTDGEVYNGFTISCATDLAGGDMGVTQTSTLDGCIDTCASTTGCVAISYVAPFCYLKNVAEGTSSSANVIAAMVDSTGPCSSGSTASSYTTGDDTFSVTCGWDYSGYDISNEQTTTFEGCMDACAANSQCYAISYTTGSWCYMKSAGVGGSANANVNVASLPSSSTTTTTTTTSPTTATSSTTTTAAASGLCINDQGGGSSFTSGSKTYTISCGFDYYGYDISLAQTSTFEGCLSACSSNSDCAAVSWTTTGFCYMKNGVSAGDDNALVMGAYVPSASSTTTTTAATTTTTTTPGTTSSTTTTTSTPSTTTTTTSSSPSTTTSTTLSTTSTTTTQSTTTPTTTIASTASTTTSAPTTTSTSASTTTTTTTTMLTTTTTTTTATTTTSSTTSSTTIATTTSSTTTVAPTTTTTTAVPATTTTSTPSFATTSSSTSTTTSPPPISTSTTTATTSVATTSTSTLSTTSTTSQTSTTTLTSSAACATNYGQCGGSNWGGATCCQGGWTCQYQNDFYYQCVEPSSTSVTTIATTGPTTTNTPSRITTTTVPTTTTTLKTSTTTAKATTTSTTTTMTTTTTKTTTTKATTTTANSKSSCATPYAQCGGWFWNGATCCSSGYRCQEQNIFYSQCVQY
ncbi:hypothetical protein LTS07_003939 [Exophiala sideris]|uniref:Carbohydrate-binding module family 1 protein n=1 Tax=Exophiala sideris TaxID=1016849 RepID=A0ABR0JE00_9EURO|nr:hypothetical protein LTS07_003939 [Exophiala sideris]KAK5037291.1 hypothetical protein LTR13_005097 [Exophiala sideris]KAK5062055.1 hypothetical protein LTR69_004412 [Exophiala sideris]KAK5182449.1 hypothetical protein LTR44_005461 [Eurotiomycetes sp. CCFEE 6388]